MTPAKMYDGELYVLASDAVQMAKNAYENGQADERERVMNEPINKYHWQRFEDEIRSSEREACAQLCDAMNEKEGCYEIGQASELAEKIRARIKE